MLVSVEGVVMEVVEFPAKDQQSKARYEVRLYQPGQRDLASVFLSANGHKVGEKVRLAGRLGVNKFGRPVVYGE